MERETLVAKAFVDLAERLVGDADGDVDEFLRLLTERSAEVVQATAVGVLLADREGRLGVASASTDDMYTLELFEMQDEQGPCFEAFQRGEQVVEIDLGSEAAHARWPEFAARAGALGFLSVHAFPLRLGSETLGALNVFFARRGAFDDADVYTLQALADVASIALVQARRAWDASEVREQLQGALDSRLVIEQAKGILAANLDLSVDEAFETMRDHARSHRRLLREVAQHVVTHHELPPE